jgi:hypothetical protein
VSTVDLDDLKRLLGYQPPLRRRPRCQHVWFDQRPCHNPAEVECDTGDGHRPRYVCGVCSRYQVAILGPIVLAGEVEVVRVNAEGGIVRARRRGRR